MTKKLSEIMSAPNATIIYEAFGLTEARGRELTDKIVEATRSVIEKALEENLDGINAGMVYEAFDKDGIEYDEQEGRYLLFLTNTVIEGEIRSFSTRQMFGSLTSPAESEE